jgi:hypothetical protein
MEPFDRGSSARPLFDKLRQAESHATSEERHPKVRTPFSYRICDMVTEGLIYFAVIFTPWAFGTTEKWSIWTMNVTCFVLGGLLAAKWFIRWQTGFTPARWGASNRSEDLIVDPNHNGKAVRWITVILGILTVAVLFYCLVSAVNARATYFPEQRRFEYRDYIAWLPHSYDPGATWEAFWSYLGLACLFWATRDWLLGKTSAERRGLRPVSSAAGEAPPTAPATSISSRDFTYVSDRLRRLLWIVCINGGILALEAILQRLSGTNKLLWLVRPSINNFAALQFGPYAYRSNAASYLNLMWPVCVGFWLVLRRSAMDSPRQGRVGQGSHILLLPCAVLMAAAPIISTARGGALIAFVNLMTVCAVLIFATRRERPAIRIGILSLFLVIGLFAGYLGWSQLAGRLEIMFVDRMSNRAEIYQNSDLIARNFPLFGTGAGTFGTIYRLYKEPTQEWAAYLHDDWLETRITFGGLGFAMILLMLLLAATRWIFSAGIPTRWEFVATVWLSITGCLVHAKFDFPFQIYSIQFLFLLLCAVLVSVSRK